MVNLQRDISLAEHTTFKTGGAARYFTTATTQEAVAEVVAYAADQQLPLLVLGGGSNILVRDGGFPGVVLHVGNKGIEVVANEETVTVTAGAGETFDDVVAHTAARGWWGLENLSHIPGSVGATPVQNVGAYGVEVSDVIERVRVYDRAEHTFLELTPQECEFTYRHSIFKEERGARYIITAVTFLLTTQPQPRLEYGDLATHFAEGATPSPEEVRAAVIAIRANKFPDWHRVGTAGSFFKNPIIDHRQYEKLLESYPDVPAYTLANGMVKLPLGWILDKVLGLRGYQQGHVECYEGQALVVVARAGATTGEVLSFATEIVRRVYEATEIEIEYEVTVVGEE